MKKAKMIYKVSELHHLFFNQALPEGARAGSMAAYGNGVLWHDRAEPAAAFLTDARGPDNKPAAVIMPHSYPARWEHRELSQAVPETVHAVELPSAWPGAPRHNDDVRNIRGGKAATSAAAICAAYTAAINHDCERAAHSALDAAGTDPADVPSYAAAVRDLLSLTWNDAGAREAARAALEAMLDAWQLGKRGQYDKKMVQAISQRRHIEKAAADKLPRLREYITERAESLKDKTGRARIRALLALKDKYNYELPGAIAAVLRAGLPPAALHGMPANISGVFASDNAAADRADTYLGNGPRLAAVWREAIKGEHMGHAAHMLARSAGVPRYIRESAAAAIEHAYKARTRASVKKQLAGNAGELAAIAAAWPLVSPLADTLAAGGEIDWSAPELAGTANRAGGIISVCREAKQADSRAARLNAEMCRSKNAALVWPANLPPADQVNAAADNLYSNYAGYAEREKWSIKAASMREAMLDQAGIIGSMPRRAQYLINQANSDLSGWAWRACPAPIVDGLKTELDELLYRAQCAAENITPMAEFMTGGGAPGPGDWLIIKGRTAKTTRGAEVPAKAIKAAFSLLDTLPAGEYVDLSAHGFMIGPFQLLRRESSGAVIVDCHNFSADSVTNIREQLAAIESAAIESASAA